MPEEGKFKRPLKFFKSYPNESLGYILSWGYIDDLKVYTIKREFKVQYFEYVKDLKTLPWWDVEEMVKIKNIQQLEWGPEVRYYESKPWYYIRGQARDKFREWMPQYPKQTVKIDPITGEKDITLHVKHPRCLKNMPLKEMEQDYYKDFRGWAYNPKTYQAVIGLRDKDMVYRRIFLIDPVWLIMYYPTDKEHALQYQKVVNVCFEKDINSGRYRSSSWSDLELEEFVKRECHNEKMDKKDS
ncbi:hypothetical protein Hanom_Chr06g00554341 [Helianthus anomalus]